MGLISIQNRRGEEAQTCGLTEGVGIRLTGTG
jgi:hypothetical protein